MSHRVPPADDQPAHSARAAQDFGCDIRFSGRSAAWIRLRGPFDAGSAEQIAQAVERAFGGARLAIVDLRRITSIDDAALRVLLDADARARRSARRLVVVPCPEQVDRRLLLNGVADRLQMIDLKPVLAASRLRSVPEPDAPPPDAA